MKKLIIFLSLLLLSPVLAADANIAKPDRQQTFLLQAPGTLSHSPGPADSPVEPSNPADRPGRARPPRYKFVDENHLRFRQFGQQRGQSNPWIEPRRTYDPNTNFRSGRSSSYSNPWHLGGAHPPELQAFQSGAYPLMPPADPMAPGIYGGLEDFYMDFSDGILNDSNPAAIGRYGFGGFMLPGIDDGSGFPFMPF